MTPDDTKRPTVRRATRSKQTRGEKSPNAVFLAALDRAIEFHRSLNEDPHNIRNAVLVSLTEVRDAMRYALNK